MDKDKYDEQLQWQSNTRKREKNWGNNVDIDIDDEIDYDENFGGNDYDERIDDHDDDYDNDPEKSDKILKISRSKKKKENERYGDNGYTWCVRRHFPRNNRHYITQSDASSGTPI